MSEAADMQDYYQEERMAAISFVREAIDEAENQGITRDCLAQAALFAAFSDMVSLYGEEETAKFSKGLNKRIKQGEFTLNKVLH